MQTELILNFTVDLAKTMLENGAEVYRVEETMGYVLSKLTGNSGNSFVTTTAIMCTINNGIDNKTTMVRIKNRTINFEKVSLANNLSRRVFIGNIDIQTAIVELEKIKKKTVYSNKIKIFISGLCLSSFSLIFNASLLDFISSFIIGIFLYPILTFLDRKKLSTFVKSILGGSIASTFTIFFVFFGIGENFNIIMTSSMMLLVPGVLLINSFRDILANDYLTGLSRLIEAIFIAICIAVGVIVILSLFIGLL
ncbi:MAG: threonine/serine exporter family protein [Defluviitaleaceae bacterium]|nr:threonine/serine exporter family protein [Defluviitaleaceae bacterium]